MLHLKGRMAHIEGEKRTFPRAIGFLALGGWLANNVKMGYIDLTLYIKIGYNSVLLWGKCFIASILHKDHNQTLWVLIWRSVDP